MSDFDRNVAAARGGYATDRALAIDAGLRAHMIRPDGSRRDSVVYSITREEWPAVRAGLEQRLASLS